MAATCRLCRDEMAPAASELPHGGFVDSANMRRKALLRRELSRTLARLARSDSASDRQQELPEMSASGPEAAAHLSDADLDDAARMLLAGLCSECDVAARVVVRDAKSDAERELAALRRIATGDPGGNFGEVARRQFSRDSDGADVWDTSRLITNSAETGSGWGSGDFDPSEAPAPTPSDGQVLAALENELAATYAEAEHVLRECEKLEQLATLAEEEWRQAALPVGELTKRVAGHWNGVNRFLVSDERARVHSETFSTRAALLNTECLRLLPHNAWQDMFLIDTSGEIATINGCRFGRARPAAASTLSASSLGIASATALSAGSSGSAAHDERVPWSEVNSAWGECALLMHILAKQLGVKFKRYRVGPLGNRSIIVSAFEYAPAALSAEGLSSASLHSSSTLGARGSGSVSQRVQFPLYGRDELQFAGGWLSAGMSALGAGLSWVRGSIHDSPGTNLLRSTSPQAPGVEAATSSCAPFDSAMKAFACCLSELIKAAVVRSKGQLGANLYDVRVSGGHILDPTTGRLVAWSTPQMKIRVNGRTIRMETQSASEWTTVLKWVLEDLQRILAFVGSGFVVVKSDG